MDTQTIDQATEMELEKIAVAAATVHGKLPGDVYARLTAELLRSPRIDGRALLNLGLTIRLGDLPAAKLVAQASRAIYGKTRLEALALALYGLIRPAWMDARRAALADARYQLQVELLNAVLSMGGEAIARMATRPNADDLAAVEKVSQTSAVDIENLIDDI